MKTWLYITKEAITLVLEAPPCAGVGTAAGEAVELLLEANLAGAVVVLLHLESDVAGAVVEGIAGHLEAGACCLENSKCRRMRGRSSVAQCGANIILMTTTYMIVLY